MLIFKICFYSVLLLLFVIFQRKKEKWKKELVFEETFEKYLSKAAAIYGKTQNVEETLWELEAEQDQLPSGRNTFVRIFEAMCALVKNEGDIQYGGTSVFLMNLQYLKEELRGHLLLYRERSYLFLGLDFLAILPIFFLPLVEWWAATTSEDIMRYYEGGYGMIALFMVFLVTVCTYLLILWLLLPQMDTEKRYHPEEKLLEQKWLSQWIDRYISRNYTECLKKNEYLKELQGNGNIREFLTKKILWACLGMVCAVVLLVGSLKMEKEQIQRNICLSEYQEILVEDAGAVNTLMHDIFFQILEENEKQREELQQLLKMELRKQSVPEEETDLLIEKLNNELTKYKAVKVKWYHLFVILIAGFAAAQMPDLFLLIDKWKSKDKRMEECLRMQTVTLLLIHYEETTVEEILMRMEEFSEVFRPALARAVDTFSYQRMQTLEKLKEDIIDEGMQRISETLLFCEELPIEQAFMNLEGERMYFLKRNQEDRNNNQREYAALARVIAYLPLFLLILLELVIPFVAEGLSELEIYSQGLTGIIL